MKKIQLKNGGSVIAREVTIDDADGLIKHINTIAEESGYVTFGPREFEITVKRKETFL